MAGGELIVLSKFIGGLFYMEGYGLGHGKSRKFYKCIFR